MALPASNSLLALGAALLVASSALGQTPKTVQTDKINRSTEIDPMIGTDGDGRLLIDWAAAEQIATSPAAPRRTASARLMLAIRDGQWRPMPK
ncbi:hypothetical protein [Tardiphaga sp. 768_D3_N2_1]|uniref:hypothetical protein n=1 Tax=Tardiphaga sp. 768_D3_N2_1 TaxID=3240783 RepID=UPI003F8A8FE2